MYLPILLKLRIGVRHASDFVGIKHALVFPKQKVCASDKLTMEEIGSSFQVFSNFISEEEENLLIDEVHQRLKRSRYEYNHWDNVSKIHGKC